MSRLAIWAGFVLASLVFPAEAGPRSVLHPDCGILWPCVAPYASTPAQVRETRGRYVAREVGIGGPVRKAHRRVSQARQTAIPAKVAVVSHPAGCPSRSFCGCGAAVRVFGRPIRNLWLAANWFRFPRAEPSAGMVAVRRHHVFVLEAHLGGSTWLAYDANSGRHQTRIHPRSIAGYVIVNPHRSG